MESIGDSISGGTAGDHCNDRFDRMESLMESPHDRIGTPIQGWGLYPSHVHFHFYYHLTLIDSRSDETIAAIIIIIIIITKISYLCR
jgi:hypothetical protein